MYKYEIFHDSLMNELLNNIRSGESRQAYIFEGPDGLNIPEAAKLFGTAVTCASRESAPCGVCNICKLSYAMTNPDISFINSGDKKSIGIDRIREMAQEVYLKPFESDFKVFIIEDGTMLTEEAQNAMLKILEEPPEYAVFIIITASSASLLPTVLSRCALVRFPPLSEPQMKDYILKKYPEHSENIEFLIRFAEGIPKKADEIINDTEFEPLRTESFIMLSPLLSKNRLTAYTVTEFLENNKERADIIFDIWQSFIRDICLIQNGAGHLIVNSDMKEKLSNLALQLSDRDSVTALQCVISAKAMLRRYVNLHILGLKLSFLIKNSIYKSQF